MFLSCRPFVVKTTFSNFLVDVEITSVSWLAQDTLNDRKVNAIQDMIAVVGMKRKNFEKLQKTPSPSIPDIILPEPRFQLDHSPGNLHLTKLSGRLLSHLLFTYSCCF